MTNNFAEIKNNWQFVLPPSRPSLHDLERIRALLCPFDRKLPVAVLGSTIEFRNLLQAMNFQNIYVFEKNQDFYEWTCSWIAFNVSRENVIWGDWLNTIAKYKNTFIAILSDLTMGNIPYENRNDFYQSIYDAVAPNGLFIDKVLTDCLPHIPLGALMEKYESLPINLQTVNRFSCEVLFCSSLLDDGVIDTSKFYDYIRQEYTSPILKKYTELAHLITPENCVWYYVRAWDEVAANYHKPYTETNVYDDVPESPYYGRAKQFVYKK